MKFVHAFRPFSDEVSALQYLVKLTDNLLVLCAVLNGW